MAGPLTVIYDVYKTGLLKKETNPPIWIILIGAFGLVGSLLYNPPNALRLVPW